MPEKSNPVLVPNRHLRDLDNDVLYHFGLSKADEDFSVFSDVKFVCTGGSGGRLALYAALFGKEAGFGEPKNLSKSERFVLYKTGPVLWISHGMGVPSLSIMLSETFKLLSYANATDVTFIRLGTSGGVDVEPGTVVVANGTLNHYFKEEFIQVICGVPVSRVATLDQKLSNELSNVAKKIGLPVAQGKTFCADDFYEGQMRLDGAFCEYTQEDKLTFLNILKEHGVKNIEMEATLFAAFTKRANCKSGIVCVALLNRVNGDQVAMDHEQYIDYELRPYKVVSSYILDHI